VPKYNLTDSEKDILKVIKNETEFTASVRQRNADIASGISVNISESEKLLESLGKGLPNEIPYEPVRPKAKRILEMRSFESLLEDANNNIPYEVNFLDIFTQQEIDANKERLHQLQMEFNSVYRLDKIDVLIPVIAGILGGAIDCAFGGFIRLENGKSVPGSLSKWVNGIFDKALPPDKIKELEKLAKVTYDAANNANTTVDVDGLSSYFHRLVSLGHDPILGFIFGVLDMLRGTMTTLDFKGNFVVQTVEIYSDRKAQGLFEAISKVFIHMLSDVNTPRGLPVPFMALFNKLQIGSFGTEKLNVSELVKSMYAEGYNFRHFSSMALPTMITEVVVRISYFIKRLSEGYSFKEALPVGINHEEKPKLATMLFIAHSTSSAINAGKVILTENPMDINYPQWIAFARYSLNQLKWVLYTKPKLKYKYIMDFINDEWEVIIDNSDGLWREMTNDAIIIITN